MGDMATPDPLDEQRHPADDQPLWNESYYFDWFDADGSTGGYVRVGIYPNLNRAWYWACLVGADRRLVTVVEHDVELPAAPSSLELRAEGLWADHIVEEPLQRMSLNLESFALEVDDASEMYHDPRGARVPFGFELDWETDRSSYLWPPVTPRYEIPCRVHGTVMVGSDTIEIDGWGQRDHSWGAARDWWTNTWSWSAGRLDDGTRFHSAGAFLADNPWGVAYVLDPGATAFREFDEVHTDARLDDEGMATEATLSFGDLALTVEPVAFSPVLLTHDDGRQARFPRALARFTADDGRRGAGWIEWNQPPEPSGAQPTLR